MESNASSQFSYASNRDLFSPQPEMNHSYSGSDVDRLSDVPFAVQADMSDAGTSFTNLCLCIYIHIYIYTYIYVCVYVYYDGRT